MKQKKKHALRQEHGSATAHEIMTDRPTNGWTGKLHFQIFIITMQRTGKSKQTHRVD